MADTDATPGADSRSGTDERWLDDAEQYCFRTFLRAHRLLEVAFEQDLHDHDLLLAEYEILVVLAEHDGPVRMSEVADTVTQSRSRLTHTARRLEEVGFVSRATDPEDRRGVLLTLTPEGRTKLRDVAPSHVATVRRTFVDLIPRADFLVLGRSFGTITKAAGYSSDFLPEMPDEVSRATAHIEPVDGSTR